MTWNMKSDKIWQAQKLRQQRTIKLNQKRQAFPRKKNVLRPTMSTTYKVTSFQTRRVKSPLINVKKFMATDHQKKREPILLWLLSQTAWVKEKAFFLLMTSIRCHLTNLTWCKSTCKTPISSMDWSSIWDFTSWCLVASLSESFCIRTDLCVSRQTSTNRSSSQTTRRLWMTCTAILLTMH